MPSHPPPDSKVQALQKHGTLNPRPQEVKDPLFCHSDFFDPRDLVQVKYEMLRRVRTDGHSVTQAAAHFGLSRPSFYKALSDFSQQGLVGLLPKKRGPRTARKLTPLVMTFIQGTLQEDPTLGAHGLVGRVEEHFGVRVHPRSIQRALQREGKKGQ